MKTVILYSSKSGYTRKYAGWLSEELSAEVMDIRKADIQKLAACDLVIFGGSLHAVGINGLEKFKRIVRSNGIKRVIVFAVGASPYSDSICGEIRSKNLSESDFESIPLFYLRGGFDYSRLPLWEKFLMTLLKYKMSKKKVRTADETGMLAAYSHPIDFTDKKHLSPLIEEARKNSS